MICYTNYSTFSGGVVEFQTKLTYGMICYQYQAMMLVPGIVRFKLSWLMEWFVIVENEFNFGKVDLFQTKLTYGMICYWLYSSKKALFKCVSN